jgi:hypothetical protein
MNFIIKLGFALATASCLAGSAAANEIIDRDLGPAGWTSSIEDDDKCHVSRADDLIVIEEAGPMSIRINVNLVGQGAELIGRNAPVSVSFRGAKGKPDIIWSDVAYHTGIGIYFDLSLQLQPDFEALHYFSNARIMDVSFDGKTNKFALVGSYAAMKMLTNCMQITADRLLAESDAVLNRVR